MTTSKDKIQQFMESPLVAWVSSSIDMSTLLERREAGNKLLI